MATSSYRSARGLLRLATIVAALSCALARGSPQAQVVWKRPGASGDWADPSNWNPSRVPTAEDDAILGSNASVTISSPAAVGSIQLASGTVLTVTANLTVGPGELLAQDNAAVLITNNASVKAVVARVQDIARFVWGGAQISGTVVVEKAASAAIEGGPGYRFNTATWNISGTLIMRGNGNVVGSSATAYLRPGALMHITETVTVNSFLVYNTGGLVWIDASGGSGTTPLSKKERALRKAGAAPYIQGINVMNSSPFDSVVINGTTNLTLNWMAVTNGAVHAELAELAGGVQLVNCTYFGNLTRGASLANSRVLGSVTGGGLTTTGLVSVVGEASGTDYYCYSTNQGPPGMVTAARIGVSGKFYADRCIIVADRLDFAAQSAVTGPATLTATHGGDLRFSRIQNQLVTFEIDGDVSVSGAGTNLQSTVRIGPGARATVSGVIFGSNVGVWSSEGTTNVAPGNSAVLASLILQGSGNITVGEGAMLDLQGTNGTTGTIVLGGVGAALTGEALSFGWQRLIGLNPSGTIRISGDESWYTCTSPCGPRQQSSYKSMRVDAL